MALFSIPVCLDSIFSMNELAPLPSITVVVQGVPGASLVGLLVLVGWFGC